MNELLNSILNYPLPVKIAIFAGMVILTHLIVILIRRLVRQMLATQTGRRNQKLRSIVTLATSGLIFFLYFSAVGLILKDFGVALTAYLASASVIGLAIGFGSQGIVQDVVTGLTFIFSDLVDVGDLVEISGQTGVVKAITMRFVELENAMGASVFIPNRTINNVINYPRGYVRCIVDVTMRGDAANRDATEETAVRLMNLVHQQFPGILLTAPSSEGRVKFDAGKEILRIKFRIWPNRGQPIETTYFQELSAELQRSDPEYKPWMIAISYEVEKRTSRHARPWGWGTPRPGA